MSSNTDAIYLEFPFLENVISRSKVSSAFIRRWNSEFLNQSSYYSMAEVAWVDEIRLLNEKGETVSIVGKRTPYQFFVEGGWLDSQGWYKPENVGQAIARIKDRAKLVKYAIQFVGTSFTLYKLPKGFSNAADWLHSEAEKAYSLTCRES